MFSYLSSRPSSRQPNLKPKGPKRPQLRKDPQSLVVDSHPQTDLEPPFESQDTQGPPPSDAKSSAAKTLTSSTPSRSGLLTDPERGRTKARLGATPASSRVHPGVVNASKTPKSEALELRTPRYTRGSPAFNQPSTGSAVLVGDQQEKLQFGKEDGSMSLRAGPSPPIRHPALAVDTKNTKKMDRRLW